MNDKDSKLLWEAYTKVSEDIDMPVPSHLRPAQVEAKPKPIKWWGKSIREQLDIVFRDAEAVLKERLAPAAKEKWQPLRDEFGRFLHDYQIDSEAAAQKNPEVLYKLLVTFTKEWFTSHPPAGGTPLFGPGGLKGVRTAYEIREGDLDKELVMNDGSEKSIRRLIEVAGGTPPIGDQPISGDDEHPEDVTEPDSGVEPQGETPPGGFEPGAYDVPAGKEKPQDIGPVRPDELEPSGIQPLTPDEFDKLEKKGKRGN